MRAVVQRVSRANVVVGGETTGEIGQGLLVLLAVGQADTESDADYLAEKVAGLRIFEDEKGKMNLAVAEIGGGVLVVSQFTLYGDVRRGKRPSFDAAAPPQRGRELYEYFVERIRSFGLPCQTGRFQEMMQVELVNDGPVTILLDSAQNLLAQINTHSRRGMPSCRTPDPPRGPLEERCANELGRADAVVTGRKRGAHPLPIGPRATRLLASALASVCRGRLFADGQRVFLSGEADLGQ